MKTLMVQNRPHYRDIISIHTLTEPLGSLLGKIRFLHLRASYLGAWLTEQCSQFRAHPRSKAQQLHSGYDNFGWTANTGRKMQIRNNLSAADRRLGGERRPRSCSWTNILFSVNQKVPFICFLFETMRAVLGITR